MLVDAETLVSGVLTELPLTEPFGVDVDVPVVESPSLVFAAAFAAFSASRFCFDAEGAIIKLFYGPRKISEMQLVVNNRTMASRSLGSIGIRKTFTDYVIIGHSHYIACAYTRDSKNLQLPVVKHKPY